MPGRPHDGPWRVLEGLLLCGPQAGGWAEAAAGAAGDLDVLAVGAGGLTDPEGALADALGMTPSGALLLRPDGIVAWRARDGDGASSRALEDVLDAVLCRARDAV